MRGARRQLGEVGLQRRRVHGHEHVRRVARRDDVVVGDVHLERRDAGDGARPGRGSRPGSSACVARSLPKTALTSVKRSPVSCMPSPESPANRMTTSSRMLGLERLGLGCRGHASLTSLCGLLRGWIRMSLRIRSYRRRRRPLGSSGGRVRRRRRRGSSEGLERVVGLAAARRRSGAGRGPDRSARPRRRPVTRRRRGAGRSAGAADPTTTTTSPASSVSTQAGGSQTVTGTDVARSSAAALAVPAGSGPRGVARRVPDSSTRISAGPRARAAEHGEVDAPAAPSAVATAACCRGRLGAWWTASTSSGGGSRKRDRQHGEGGGEAAGDPTTRV